MNTTEHLNTNTIIEFCGCTLDTETQTLHTKTEIVRLRSKLWQLLIELVSKPNKLVLRNFLIETIWNGNEYTGEQGLTHAICHLRRILKKYHIDAKIVTLPKKGYTLKTDQAAANNSNGFNQSFSTTHHIKVLNEDTKNSSNDIDFQYSIS
ncbi:winged helix-turn-helix domain-containing protein [Aliikangiella sp. IMCC44359]|uniref:winged helix-turn-helix domain-containing protein n=1 Tax=Aliikangiella sp. IMCC44359 TaxID=3459125 RepID=UPI00403AB1EF